MKIIVDLDGTICTEFTLIIYSARTWAEYELTIDWLKRNKIPFDQLILGKPQGDYWIDDRAIRYNSWESILKKIL